MSRIGLRVRRVAAIAALLLGWTALPAAAAPILFTVEQVDGAHWRYEYYADDPANVWSLLSGFTVYFDQELYGAILTTTAPADWDLFVAQPSRATENDPNAFPAPGIFDALASADGPVPAPFVVDFTWLGAGTPGSQPYSIYFLDPFALNESGMTEPLMPDPIPEPGTVILLATGLAGAALRRRRRRAD